MLRPGLVALLLVAAHSAVHPAVVAAYPNPVADGDAGESVTVALPTAANWTLDDGETAVDLPANVTGRVVVADRPDPPGAPPDAPVVVRPALELSNAGERLALERGGTVVDALAYEDAPEGERLTDAGWEPLGASAFRVRSARDVPVTAFALPDAPGVPLRFVRSADERLLLAGYTFTSPRVRDALAAAAERGVEVRVLVEGGPVGGASRREARALDALDAAGVAVTVLDGPVQRYRFHHAKYAVADDRAFVTSENWKPTGTGGRGTRGWGTVVRSPRLADHLAAVFAGDAGWRDGLSWDRYRRNATFYEGGGDGEAYPSRFDPVSVRAERVEVMVAPDNAGGRLRALLGNATESVLVEQMAVERNGTLIRATVAAARRGARVRVLLSGAWYARESNGAVVEHLNALAEREGLPLTARLVDPRSRYSRVHVKGVVVDGERVVVGSVNWNPTSVTENREVALVVHDRTTARYFGRVFRADWRVGAWRVGAGTVAACALGLAAAGVALRRGVRFE